MASFVKPPLTLIVCGALAGHVREIIARRGWRVELLCLPGLLHNRPKEIAPEVERLAIGALSLGQRVAIGYADPDFAANHLEIPRNPIVENFTFFDQ